MSSSKKFGLWTLVMLIFVPTFGFGNIATKGVKRFSKISDFGGKFTIGVTVIFIVFAVLGYFMGTPSATEFTSASVIPKLDVEYFSTFSWLLFAVAGAEVAGTYISEVDNPKKTFPKGVFLGTLFVALAYIIGSFALCLIASPEVLTEAGIKDAAYVVWMESPIRAIFSEVPANTFPKFLTEKEITHPLLY
ncbi:amino acid permease [Alloiococcus sp. CFN-8]|uniref:amino acid permease n=1 Tax=Alloiococcus sp. CFN-8 TaxID=3416081 RepID=UPI003CF2ABAF